MDDQPTLPTVSLPGGRPPQLSQPTGWIVWMRRLLIAALVSVIGGVLAVWIGIVVLSQGLPTIRSLNDYQPHQATVIYGRGGEVVARFAKERRTVVPFDVIPNVMVDAVVSAEDAGFFEHTGIDFMGIARCVIKNVIRGRAVCGASTITQQTVKTFFLTPEKSIIRKLKEMILAKRLEEALTKQDILYLYLNQIYFGHGAYGVEAASRVYFGKSVSKLEVQEAALLAGLPQSPSRLDPYRHSQRAMKRRAYVLERMYEQQKISDAQYEMAKASPLELDWRSSETSLDSNNHYAAHVRKILEALVGKARLSSGGLKVYTGLDPTLQKTAEESLRRGLRALDKRQGWRGPLRHLERNELKSLLKLLAERRNTSGIKKRAKKNGADSEKDGESALTIWDLSNVRKRKAKSPEGISSAARLPRFEVGQTYGGPVVTVDDARKQAKVDLGGVHVILPLRSGLGWARKFDIHTYTQRPTKPSDVLKVGDIVLVRATKPYASKKESKPLHPTYQGRLEQTPKVEAALVSIDPQTREVRALVGGYGLGAGTFNRAVQAKRQPGSTFKPFVYASAFATEKYTPLSICLDAPRVYRDPWTGRSWKPQNY
ncbi:MAG: transglycosylase domain-containing protein, partial [Myxococcota bacterium]